MPNTLPSPAGQTAPPPPLPGSQPAPTPTRIISRQVAMVPVDLWFSLALAHAGTIIRDGSKTLEQRIAAYNEFTAQFKAVELKWLSTAE